MRAIPCLIDGMYIGFTDVIAAFYRLDEKIKHARYKVRDEVRQITWVNDRLSGLTPENCRAAK
jgi:hypothetical protein